MKLNTLLNKISNNNFLLTVEGLFDEMPFREYEAEKKQPYWKDYKDRDIEDIMILTTNDKPELYISLKDTEG